ncbi:hypothetical protein [Allokutzneria sp. NRRL B-24872]|uniref:hypothetical protein n=1 Tax=Allokutzneria sp. NRRL B-24872 TaxID=1137961 RepID=UPI000A3A0745|nr:hypothetical protein [Allokutzneria sp. NRRL B-24872]
MTPPGRDYSWLPEHQFHTAYTLAHVDALIGRAGEVLYDYFLDPGPFTLENIVDGQIVEVRVKKLAPLPAAVARYAADAMTQLRALIEHTIFAEVEYLLGRALTDDEARAIEMPAATSEAKFVEWLRQRRRRDLLPLHDGEPLVRRLRHLQPYQRVDIDNHPMRVLAEHTNLAKHRTPAIAAVRLGRVILDAPEPAVTTMVGGPLQVGDVLAAGPSGKQVPLTILPEVSIQRPHTKTWHIVMKELGALQEWTRTTAIPHLIAGTSDVSQLPPGLDITIGHENVRAALSAASEKSAVQRSLWRIQAETARQSLTEILALHHQRVDPAVIRTWLDGLNDDAVMTAVGRMQYSGAQQLDRVVREMLAEAVTATGRS